jgi:polyisoprenyl-teichoic acid--peptidoglycan teichoic acid transferase
MRLAAAGLGVALGVSVLGLVWPRSDRSQEPQALGRVADLAKPPTRPVTVLVIGSDADRPGDASNGAAPLGPANSDALLLLRVQPGAPLQVLEIPIETAVQLPGQPRPQALGSLYRQGGVALVADAVRELTGLPSTQPDRYAVVPRGALRQLIAALGSIDLSPPQAMRYVDRRQNLRIDLQAGLQRLDGQQVEQLVRFRDPVAGEDGRRQQHQLLVRALLRELSQPGRLPLLAPLARQMLAETQSDLSEAELLSLLAAGLSQGDAVDVKALSLDPAQPQHKGLRQLAPGAAATLGWGSGS